MPTKTKVIIGAVILAVIGGYFIFRPSGNSSYEYFTVKRGDLAQEVSVTGNVKPSESVDLAFEKSGRVSRVYVDVGDKVYSGQTLVQLENGDIYAQLLQAEASVKSQQAKLDELKLGTRPEEIQVQEVKVKNAETALADAEKTLIDKINDAYTKSDDAIRNKTDQIFNNPLSQSPVVNFTGGDASTKIYLENTRPTIESLLVSWKNSLDGLGLSSDLDSYKNTASNNLESIKSFLEKSALFINTTTANTSITQTTIDAYRADISTARTNIYTAITNLSAAYEGMRTAESDLTLEQNQLALKKAGTLAEQITAQEAEVEEAEANVKNYQAQVLKTIIRSPINGIVTKQEAKVGEIMAANTVTVSVISEGRFEIEANVPEADIAKINIGDPAAVTLDAYGNSVVFDVKVIKIDPAETEIEGVATYKVTFQFVQEDSRLKSGMTANIDITTNKVENALFVPQRAVSGKNGDRKVLFVEKDGSVKEISVKAGIRSVDGNLEIIEGLKEGDKVAVSLK